MVNNVVASVLNPVDSNMRQACSPSHELGILMQIRDASKPGAIFRDRAIMPYFKL